MRVLVCGSHDFADRAMLTATLNRLHKDRGFVLVIVGGASGADTLAEEWSKARDVACQCVPCRLGRVRTQQMLDEGRPELGVAFPGGRDPNHRQ